MSSIPYADRSAIVYSIDPEEKFQRTVVEGSGNCSNLVFGTAYFLCRIGVPFHIVHILPRRQFLDGWGHTILQANCRWDDGPSLAFVDVMEGGIPVHDDGEPISMGDLARGQLRDLLILCLNAKHDSVSSFYGDLLDRSTIGLIQGTDVKRYFDFLERLAIPLGPDKLEKVIYDGLAVLWGVDPRIHVSSFEATFLGASRTRLFFLGALWFLRASALAVPVLLVVEILRARARRPRRRCAQRGERSAVHPS